MQASLPVITSSGEQILYTIESDIHGWIVPSNNEEVLANAFIIPLNPASLSGTGI